MNLKELSDAADPREWVAAPYEQHAEAVTVGNFGDWRIQRATPGIPGGNYRDTHFGSDEANARLAAALVNEYRAGRFVPAEQGDRNAVLEEAALHFDKCATATGDKLWVSAAEQCRALKRSPPHSGEGKEG